MMLTGGRVMLRPLEESDLERTLVWVNTPEIVDALSIRAPVSAEQQREWFDALGRDPGKIVFAVCRVDTAGRYSRRIITLRTHCSSSRKLPLHA